MKYVSASPEGVGKGRQIAGLILEHKLTGGKRCLWISTSNDLRYDAVRDLGDVGARGIQVWPEVKPFRCNTFSVKRS